MWGDEKYLKNPIRDVPYLILFLCIGIAMGLHTHLEKHIEALALLFLASFFVLYILYRRHELGDRIGATVWYVILLGTIIWVYARIYSQFGLINSGEEVRDFNTCLYFSIVTWTTLGYGDFQPSTNARVWAASEALMGYYFMGILVAIAIEWLGESTRKPKK